MGARTVTGTQSPGLAEILNAPGGPSYRQTRRGWVTPRRNRAGGPRHPTGGPVVLAPGVIISLFPLPDSVVEAVA